MAHRRFHFPSRLQDGGRGATVAACALLSALIFAIDLLTPREILVGLLYVAVVLLATRLPGRRALLVAAGACSLLAGLAPLFGTPRAAALDVIVNRGLTVLVLWVSAGLLIALARAQASIRASEARLRTALEAADMGTWDCDLRSGTFVVDERQSALLGLEASHRAMPLEAGFDLIHPDDLPSVNREWREALARQSKFHAEFRVVRPDGTIRWLLAGGRISRDAQGRAVAVAGVNLDITEQKDAEQAMAKLAAMVEHSDDAIYRKSLEGIIETWNPGAERLFGYKPSEIIGQSVQLLVPADRAQELADVFAKLARGEPVVSFDTVRRRKDGRHVDVSLTVSPIKDPAGRVVGGATIAQDITDRKHAERALTDTMARLEERIMERTGALLRKHEQLRAMASELTLSEHRERRRLATDLHDYLAQLLVACRLKVGQRRETSSGAETAELWREADAILDQALTYTRTLVAELSPRVLYESGLPATLRWLAGQMQQHGLHVTARVEAESVPLSEDQAVLLYQTVRELLFNVRKHAGTQEASVSLAVSGDGQLTISVADSGRGFTPQARVEEARRQTKFGLFSIQERVEALNGRLEIDSAPGEGTRATLRIPLQRTAPRPRQPQGVLPANAAPDGPSSPISVVLVDDHTMVRQGLRSVLETYHDLRIVGEAADGEEAVEVVRTTRPRVVVMDVKLPRTNGVDATRRIVAAYPEVRIIGLSNDPGTERAMIEAGAVAQLDKAKAASQLYLAIRAALGAKKILPEG